MDAGKLMSYLFELAAITQSHDTDLDLYSLFTKEECYDLWLISNLNWYIDYGPSPLTQGKMPYVEANLLENILNTVDTCVVKKRIVLPCASGTRLVYFLWLVYWN